MKALIDFDGGCRGNPGRAASAFVLRVPASSLRDGESAPLGPIERAWPLEKATNNVAEYMALLGGLCYAKALQVHRVEIRGDSKLVVEQINGGWRAKDYVMSSLRDQCRMMLDTFIEGWSLEWIGRAENSEADGLTASILGERKSDRVKRQRSET